MFIGLMATTHVVMAIAGCCFFLGDSSLPMIAIAAVGSQIPDLDTTTSVVGRLFYPVSHWIEQRYPHRTVTHSLGLTIWIAAVAIVPWILLNYSWRYWVALPLAHLLSCLGDTLTKTGIAWLWPNPARVVFLRNPHRRIETGTPTEYFLLVVLVAIALLATDINTNGGLWLAITRSLGNAQAVEAVMNESGAQRHIWVEVNGVMTGDRNPINRRFFVVAQSGPKRFVIQDDQGIYETETQIIAHRMRVEPGEVAAVREEAIAFNDEPLLDPLITLYEANPSSAIYLTGSITVDAPEEMHPALTPNQLQTIVKTGNQIQLHYADLVTLGKLSSNQWATGQMIARIVTPTPF